MSFPVPNEYRSYFYPFDESSKSPKVPDCSLYSENSYGYKVRRLVRLSVDEVHFPGTEINDIKANTAKPNWGFVIAVLPCSLNGYMVYSYFNKFTGNAEGEYRLSSIDNVIDSYLLVNNNVGNNGLSTLFNYDFLRVTTNALDPYMKISEILQKFTHWRCVSSAVAVTSSSGGSLDSGTWQCMDFEYENGYLYGNYTFVLGDGAANVGYKQVSHYRPNYPLVKSLLSFTNWSAFGNHRIGPVSDLKETVFACTRRMHPHWLANPFKFTGPEYVHYLTDKKATNIQFETSNNGTLLGVNGIKIDFSDKLYRAVIDPSYNTRFIRIEKPACGASFVLEFETNLEGIPVPFNTTNLPFEASLQSSASASGGYLDALSTPLDEAQSCVLLRKYNFALNPGGRGKVPLVYKKQDAVEAVSGLRWGGSASSTAGVPPVPDTFASTANVLTGSAGNPSSSTGRNALQSTAAGVGGYDNEKPASVSDACSMEARYYSCYGERDFEDGGEEMLDHDGVEGGEEYGEGELVHDEDDNGEYNYRDYVDPRPFGACCNRYEGCRGGRYDYG